MDTEVTALVEDERDDERDLTEESLLELGSVSKDTHGLPTGLLWDWGLGGLIDFP